MNTRIKNIPIKVIAYYLAVAAVAALLLASPALRAAGPDDHGLSLPGEPVSHQKFETSTNIAPVIVVFVVVFAAGTKLAATEKSQETLAAQL